MHLLLSDDLKYVAVVIEEFYAFCMYCYGMSAKKARGLIAEYLSPHANKGHHMS